MIPGLSLQILKKIFIIEFVHVSNFNNINVLLKNEFFLRQKSYYDHLLQYVLPQTQKFSLVRAVTRRVVRGGYLFGSARQISFVNNWFYKRNPSDRTKYMYIPPLPNYASSYGPLSCLFVIQGRN